MDDGSGDDGSGDDGSGDDGSGDDGSGGDSDIDSDDYDDKMEEDYHFTLLRWVLIIFFRLQHKYNISSKAANALLAFFTMLLNIVAHPLCAIFPTTLKGAMKRTEVCHHMEKKLYNVCPKESCSAIHNSGIKRCNKTIFGKECGSILGYNRHLSYGKVTWKPFKTFQFIPPSVWLKKMYTSSEFNSLLDNSHVANADTTILEDISDGRLWKELIANGYPIGKYNLCLMMNVDWFKPFKRSEYKVAAIMLTVLNLPRGERLKKKWTMIAGIL